MRHFSLFLFVLFVSLLLTCCSLLKTSDTDNFHLDGSVASDMGVLNYNSLCGERVDIDCTLCLEFCSRESSSSGCFQNRCSCGFGSECGSTSECRFDQCIDTDPEGINCEFDETCEPGFLCIRNRCSPAGCIPETCNGYDDDCDGRIDGNSNGPLARWCYGTNSDTNNISLSLPCRQGSQICANGAWQQCEGAISPIPENGNLACDLTDNDCDGCVDGFMNSEGICTPHENIKFDVVFAIDRSGSMREALEAVQSSVSAFSSEYSARPNFRFGIVLFPLIADGDWGVMQPLAPFADFHRSLYEITLSSFGEEASRDVLFSFGNGSIDIGWGPDTTRIIIMITDERPQSYLTPVVTEETICESFTHGEVVAVVTSPLFFSEYNDCSLVFSLSEDPTVVSNNLSTIIQNPCN